MLLLQGLRLARHALPFLGFGTGRHRRERDHFTPRLVADRLLDQVEKSSPDADLTVHIVNLVNVALGCRLA